MPPPFNESNSSGRFWREYSSTTTPALGTAIDLSTVEGAGGQAPREVVMLADGTLNVLNADGVDCSIATSLASGTALPLQLGTIKATQTAAILVIW